MRRLFFYARLKSDVIFSEKSATTGGHSALSYIPGSAFLGLCASKLYSNFEKQGVSYDVFHGGSVRFSDAYPLDGSGYVTLPVPMSWHVRKGNQCNNREELEPANIFSLLCPSDAIKECINKSEIQAQQIREGFFSKNGAYVLPSTGYRMKTAMDREKGGKPIDSQLFGYESLKASSPWFFFVDFDDSITAETEAMIKDALCGLIKIGKSRTAEYGMVEVRKIDNYTGGLYSSGISSGRISFYCFSDVALRDENTGAPTLLPHPSLFGIDRFDENAAFNPEKSFIRTRIYAPFNNKRKANDLERQVICKGSVITFSLSKKGYAEADLEVLKNVTARGIGMYLHDGLGKVFVNPDFLLNDSFTPVAGGGKFFFNEDKQAAAYPNDDLYKWLQRRKAEHDLDKRAIILAEDCATAFLKGLKHNNNKGPGKTQWSRLREIALSSKSITEIDQALFGAEKSLCSSGKTKADWEKRFPYRNSWTSFSDFLRHAVLGNKKEADLTLLRKALYLLGNRMPHKINQEGNK